MLKLSKEQQTPLIRRYLVIGPRKLSNYWWASVLFLGAAGFLLTGISSYLHFNLLFFVDATGIVFFPQGLVMCFYGFLGFLLSFYLWLIIFWSVGSGFNEFNKKDGFVRIFRWGFPGKNRRIDFSYKIENIESVRVELKDTVNSRRTIYIRVKERPSIEEKSNKKNPGSLNLQINNQDKNLEYLLNESQNPETSRSVQGLRSQHFNKNVQPSKEKTIKRDIPITKIGEVLTLEEIEEEGTELAQFLGVPLERLQ